MCFDLTGMRLDLISMRPIRGQPEKVLYYQGLAEGFEDALLTNDRQSTSQGKLRADMSRLEL
jgi:hypothetical protein